MKKGWEMKTMFGFLSANGAALFSTNGATSSQPGATPQVWDVLMNRGPSARPKRRTTVQTSPGDALRCLGTGALPLQSPNGAAYDSPGQRPGAGQRPGYRYPIHQAPTGRPNISPHDPPFGSPFQGSEIRMHHDLGRCPRLAWDGALPRKKGGQR